MAIKKNFRNNSLLPELSEFVEGLDVSEISPDRKTFLDPLKDLMELHKKEGSQINLNFVCTHNSRRSQFAQIWGSIFMSMSGISGEVVSSGTEKTQVHENVIETLLEIGFRVIPRKGKEIKNVVFHSFNQNPVKLYSKTIEELDLDSFAHIFVCSQAKETCPVILSDSKSYYLPFEDPGSHDQSQNPIHHYIKSAQEIATELYYVFGLMK